MRVAVIGAGAIGGTIAALLARDGHDVEVTARGDHLDAIREHGIHLTGAWGEYAAKVDAAPELRHAPELAIVTTKAQDAGAAMRDAAHLLRGIPVVIVQNGLSSVSEGRAALPRADIVGALALFAASYVSPGVVTVTARGSTYLGGDESEAGLPALFVSRVLGAVMPVTVTDDFAGAQWTKLVVNQINALPAITGLSAQAVIANGQLRWVMTVSMRETVRVAASSGVRFATLQGLSHRLLQIFGLVPFALAQLLPLALARRMGSTPNPGSTLQSIRRGQLTEIDYLNGAVVSAAETAGSTAPINATLVRLVHEVESTGRFLMPDEVIERVHRVPVP